MRGSRCIPLLVTVGVTLSLLTPRLAGADAKGPYVSVEAGVDANGSLVARGRVQPSRTRWHARLETRASAFVDGKTRTRWSTIVRSGRLPKSGRFVLRAVNAGTNPTLRVRVLSGRRTIALSRPVSVVASGPTTQEPSLPAGPGTTPPVGNPTGVPTPSPTASVIAAPTMTAMPTVTASPTPSVTPTRSELSNGGALMPGERLTSPNGAYTLDMQASDGNLVLYKAAQALWSTGGHGAGSRAVMQSDGNFVVYNGSAKWSTGTAGYDGSVLRLQDDGNLVVYYAGRAIWTWAGGYGGDILNAGQELPPGRQARSANGQYRLVMQSADGNLVLYKGDQPLWSTGANGAGSHAAMQADGNFVVYNGNAKWATNGAGFGGAFLAVQDDGNLVEYHNGRPIWTRDAGYLGDTLGSGWTLEPGAFLKSSDKRYTLVMQATDGNLVEYGPGGAVWAFDTGGHPGARAVMQTDGNFVVYVGGTAVRATGTSTAGSFLRVQDDDNLVVYSGSTAVWSRKGAADVQGPVNIANAAIADQAERHVGENRGAVLGQCLRFAGDMIVDAGGPRWWFGDNTSTYQSQWAQHAARVASIGAARRGDIIQWGGGDGGSPDPHTAIVTSAGGDPGLVDANFGIAYTVRRGSFSSRNGNNGHYRIWRVGKI